MHVGVFIYQLLQVLLIKNSERRSRGGQDRQGRQQEFRIIITGPADVCGVVVIT